METEFYDKLLHCISNFHSLQTIALVVLFNFLNDYEPAQKFAAERGCVNSLLSILKETFDGPSNVPEYTLKCLELVIRPDTQPNEFPEESIIPLLELANNPSTTFGLFQTAFSCLALYLRGESSKIYISQSLSMQKFLALMFRLQHWEDITGARGQSVVEEDDREDVSSFIRKGRNTIFTAVSDASASTSFQINYPIHSTFMDQVRELLISQDINHIVCAALILGNVARDTESCRILADDYQVHLSLCSILKEQTQVGALHAAGGALKNMVVGYPSLRENIVEAGVLEHCQKFYLATVMIEVQHMGLSLVRLLLATSPSNVARLLEYDPRISPLAQIFDLYETNTEAPIRVEVGRIVASILRETAKRPIESSQKETLWQRIFQMCPRFIHPVIQMTTLEKWPVVASEGWFALALFAQYQEGANVLAELVFPRDFYQALTKVMSTSETVPEKTSDTLLVSDSEETIGGTKEQQKKDKDNVYIFLSEFLRNTTSKTHVERKRMFQLLKDGKPVDAKDFDNISDSF
ncbi:hypothetical protein TWF694_008672 [Orbilia ellipsospora]|uniref:26S proteasome non-ATPase regulatory subunit 5 n=1 Tax=Orbilia ellipsospora TaxID=2528407 RepID=A0AAV9XDF8_9PEZI